MTGIPGMFGLGGGSAGSGFGSPQIAPILPGATETRRDETYVNARNAGDQQAALLAALQGQGGIGNQSQVYGQLQDVVAGRGPNPAQAQLAQATGQNVANQAAMMAGQRGAGANVGLLARQAAQQGAATQQNAIGQMATLQAQQSLNAMGQAGQMANTQAGQQIGATTANTQAQQNQEQIIQNAIAAQNTANVGAYGNVNTNNATMAGQQVGMQQKLLGGGLNVLGPIAGGVLGLTGSKDKAKPSSTDTDATGTSTTTVPADSQGMTYAAGGGMIGRYANGGAPMDVGANPNGPQSGIGKFLSGWSWQDQPPAQPPIEPTPASPPPQQDSSDGLIQAAAKYGPMMMKARGGNVGSKLKGGGHVPGQAKAAGNSYSNDTVKALLSPGELVVDRETMKDKGKAGEAARFLSAVIAAKKRGKK